ncbi:MAG: DUF4876 domain-containing protein [Prevotella sp.]|jgi:hypothetical protein|nr:DUF4876 domain-containing protein [Prevotella sp.]
MNLQKLFFLLIAVLLIGTSCSDNDDNDEYQTYDVTIKLAYPTGYSPVEKTSITLVNKTTTATYTGLTNASGEATFKVAAGIYDVSATESRAVDGSSFLLNGLLNFTVAKDWVNTKSVELTLTGSKKGSIIIKELYTGGCQKNDGSGKFQNDAYVVLYNNSDIKLTLENVALGTTIPYNFTSSNKYYKDGKLSYEAEGWIPAGTAIWYFKNPVSIEAGKQIVIALKNAVDNTKTYSNSINFANSEYYCTYDISGQYTNVSVYPSPAPAIPASHYLSAAIYGAGNAWPISALSPAFFIFTTKGTTPTAFAGNANNRDDYFGTTVSISMKVPTDWVLDGVEVKGQGVDGLKRLTPSVDAGYVTMIGGFGYSIYRNVDKEATEALTSNAGKLVYNYSLGTTDKAEGSTDPSGIDAEASIKNGARIIYKDTNNSTNDFHQRIKASLKD